MNIVVFVGCTITHMTMQDGASNVLNRVLLTKLKVKAIRAGVWFKALTRIDRVLVDLTIKVTENIRSSSLANCIFAVLGKLEGVFGCSALSSLRAVGRPLAEKVSLIAQTWGNVSAKGWASDLSFAFFLAVMQRNS